MSKYIHIAFLILICTLICAGNLYAKCPLTNKHFKGGEKIKYNLYFKYGIMNLSAGVSTLNTEEKMLDGKPAYEVKMIARSQGAASAVYSVNDTIISHFSKKLEPLSFSKLAHEKGNYTQEYVSYSYKDDSVYVNTKRIKNGSLRFDKTIVTKDCIYDYISSLFYARVQDYTGMGIGDKIDVNFISGSKLITMQISLVGIEDLKAANGKKYECLVLTLSVLNDAFSNPKEAMTVYLSNDTNQIPIRIDTKLKKGKTTAILKSAEGLL